MSETLATAGSLPGLEPGAISLSALPKSETAARPRVQPVDRSPMMFQTVDVERLIEEDHPARAIWAFVGQLDLGPFYAPIEAVEGVSGSGAVGPALAGQPVALRLQPRDQFGA